MLPALLFVLACSDPADTGTVEPARCPGCSVVLVVVDAMRADHLDLYGYERPTAPVLAEWASRGVIFDAAQSQAPWTLPAMASVLAGVNPQAHGCVDLDTGWVDDPVVKNPSVLAPPPVVEPPPDAGTTLASEWTTLPERFAEGGYRTAGLIGSEVILGAQGYDQGWQEFVAVGNGMETYRHAGLLTDAALSWLDLAGQDPFVLWLHYMEPHAPYQAPEPWYDQFDAGSGSKLSGAVDELLGFEWGLEAPGEADLARLNALYDGEIAYFDSEFDRLRRVLEQRDDLIVVFMGDHGEQFWEHGGLQHWDLYQELIHVPLVFSVPGVEARRVEGPVTTMDLAPTLSALVDLEPAPEWQGRSLASALAGASAPPRFLYADQSTVERGAILAPEGQKLILRTGGRELYALASDPRETRDGGPSWASQILEEELFRQVEEGRRLREEVLGPASGTD